MFGKDCLLSATYTVAPRCAMTRKRFDAVQVLLAWLEIGR